MNRNRRGLAYENILTIQSSGTGKSRTVHELAGLVFTLPFNLRESDGNYITRVKNERSLSPTLKFEIFSKTFSQPMMKWYFDVMHFSNRFSRRSASIFTSWGQPILRRWLLNGRTTWSKKMEKLEIECIPTLLQYVAKSNFRYISLLMICC